MNVIRYTAALALFVMSTCAIAQFRPITTPKPRQPVPMRPSAGVLPSNQGLGVTSNPFGAYLPGTTVRPQGQSGPYSIIQIQPGYMLGQQGGMNGSGNGSGQFGFGGGMNGFGNGSGQFGLGGGMNGLGGGAFGAFGNGNSGFGVSGASGGFGQLGSGFGGMKGFGFNGGSGI
jgi:hypothetical protein